MIKLTRLSWKNIWNWLQLVLIPLVLVGSTIWFVMQQRQTSFQIAENQQQEALLMNYIDGITDLVVHGKLLNAKTTDQAAVIAQAHTLIILQRLDNKHKGALLSFLYHAGLINRKNAIINLSGADLRGATLVADTSLNGAYLSAAKLDFAYLSYVQLVQADLSHANLSHANLSRSDLTDANLSRSDLTDANLSRSDLTDANLSGTIITQLQLAQAKSLHGTIMPDGSKHP